MNEMARAGRIGRVAPNRRASPPPLQVLDPEQQRTAIELYREQLRRERLVSIFAGDCPQGAAAYLAEVIVSEIPNIDPAAVTPRATVIGNFVQALRNSTVQLELVCPTLTVFYGVKIGHNDATGASAYNTDVGVAITDRPSGSLLIGDTAQPVPIDAFLSPYGKTYVASWISRAQASIIVRLTNFAAATDYNLAITLFGLGVYRGQGVWQ